MKLLKFISTQIFLGLVLFISCSKEEVVAPQFYRDYFPVQVGHWVVYNVDSVFWNDFYDINHPNFHDTVHYQIKERIESEFFDNENRLTQRIERYFRKTSKEDWEIKDIWAVNVTPTNAQKVEENVRFVKMIFPVKKNSKWNGNLYNTNEPLEYKYSEVHESFLLNDLTYDSTVFITQRADSSLIDCNYFVEIYAKKVGLIYKRERQLNTEVDGTITKGYDCTFKAVEWGN